MAGLKLNEEHRQALLGLMPFTQNGTIDYTPRAFENAKIPDKLKAVFTMRAYKKEEMTRIRTLLKNIGKDDDDSYSEEIRELTRISIVGWKNMFDLSNFDAIEFKKDADGSAQKETFELISDIIISDLYRQACIISGLLPKEVQGLES